MSRKTGIWAIGALGDISTCAIVGVEAIKEGLTSTCGMVTELDFFREMELVPIAGIVFGGYDIRKSNIYQSAIAFAKQNGVLNEALIEKLRENLFDVSANIKNGLTLNCGDAVRKLNNVRLDFDSLPLQGIVETIQRDIAEFKEKHGLDNVVVINLASAEEFRETNGWSDDPERLREIIRDDKRDILPASVLYAYAAVDGGYPYINFTSSLGSSCKAIDAIAREKGVPHMGKDGKTGETLVKSVLAPMFYARNLKVMSWESHNILGNRDGMILDSPKNKIMKLNDKNELLPAILKDDEVNSHVRIDYVPSLGDWKTAWDFIHFMGFMNTKMSLQFTWQGADSLLAAPLAIDLARLADDARLRGEKGALPHLSSFFKSPYGVEEHGFAAQFDTLLEYVESRRGSHAINTRH